MAVSDKHLVHVYLPNSVWPQVLDAVEAASKKQCPHCGQTTKSHGKYGAATWVRDLVLGELARLDTEKKKKPGPKKKKKRGPYKKRKQPEPVVVSSDKEPYAVPIGRS